MVPRAILHCDINAFYAAVEMQRRPELRNKPLAVCGRQEDRHGIVLTANYIAKCYGVKTGMAIWQAKKCCETLEILPPDMSEYIRFSKMAREIFDTYSDQVEPFGLDEAFIDVTGSTGLFGSPMTIAQEISARVKFELGITISTGVSFNKVFAKLGSDYKKPDAITRIGPDNFREIVFPLPVKDLLYVGPATDRKLHAIGIHTIGQLAETPMDYLIRKFGKIGGILHTFANGLDTSPVLRTDHISNIKSVGNSITTPRDLVSNEDVQLILLLLAESVASRMRELVSRCTILELSVRDTNLSYFTRRKTLQAPTSSSIEISKIAFKLFCDNYQWQAPIRSLGIRGAGLITADTPLQISLFQDDIKRDHSEQLDIAVDRIRNRYGYMSVRRALTLTDPLLGQLNPKDDHTVHPVGFFGR